ncbi:MAG: serine hydrolase domain-containing protein [Anaerolineae bacterium]
MVEISGYCDGRFARVGAEFERNFAERGDVGASVCVTLAGETVVDLWGGLARPQPATPLVAGDAAPWERDTVGLVFSSTKGAVALCAHVLAARGLLDLDAPVAAYWPEFAQVGKGGIPVRMLLNHQAGLPAIRHPLPRGAFYDWDYMVAALAAEAPFWEPGTRHAYHWYTFGWLVGEVVRRASGKPVGAFLREEVAGPLGLDLWIGLPEEVEPRVAPMIVGPRPEGLDRESIAGLVWYNDGGFLDAGECDSRTAHAAAIPAINGITNARGLAGMYAPLACGGSLHGVRLVGADDIARMGAVVSASGRDGMLGMATRYSLGFQKFGPGNPLAVPEEGFGHAGMGGSVGFADPKAAVSFGYVMNRHDSHLRASRLIDAVYLSLGYTSKASGAWV